MPLRDNYTNQPSASICELRESERDFHLISSEVIMDANIYLHHYPASLFSEKIRLMLGYLGVPWH